MELDQFLKISLKQIVDGVHGAKDHVRARGGLLNPVHRYDDTDQIYALTQPSRISNIKFDIAVTARENNASEGGGNLQVGGVFGIGTKHERGSNREGVTRIQFEVPISLPVETVTTPRGKPKAMARAILMTDEHKEGF
ncbi:MAG: hypothetical protein AAAFM81_11100 [Pseudomonadota bacterium]